MELWIKSKDKNKFGVTKYVYVDGNSIHGDCGWLGDYESEERCREIINDIEQLVLKNIVSNFKVEYYVYEMPKQ